MESTGYCCRILLKHEFSREFFKNEGNVQVQNLLKVRPIVAIK